MLSSVKLCEIFQHISRHFNSLTKLGLPGLQMSPGSTARWSWSTGKPFGPTRRRRTAVALWATDVQQHRCLESHGDSDDSSCAQFSVWRALKWHGNLRFDCNAARANWQAAWSEAPGNEFECHCDN